MVTNLKMMIFTYVLPSLKIELENQEKEYEFHKNLMNFTDMLFYYCSHDKQVEELMENVEISIKTKSDNSIASSFLMKYIN